MAEIHDPREATLVVAASNSLTKSADYRCDGTADEVQIQAALDAVAANAWGGLVSLTEGLFTVADTVFMPNQNYITLEGKGATSTTIRLADTVNKAVIAKATPGTTKYRQRLLDFGIEGNSANNATGTYGIDFTGMEGAVCQNVRVYDTKSHGFYADTVNGITLRDTHAVSVGGAGYYLDTIAGWMFDSIWSFDSGLHGFTIQIGYENYGVNISCDQDAGDSFSLSSDHRSHYKNIWVAPLTQYKYGLNLYTCQEVSVDGGSFYPPGAASADARGVFFTAATTDCRNVIVSNFTFDGTLASTASAVWQTEGGGGVISGCKLINCSFVGITNVLGTARGPLIFRNCNGYSSSGDVVTMALVIDHAALTDNADATAYMDFVDQIPAFSMVKSVYCDFTEAFNSDDTTTLTMMIGYVGDLDAFNKTADPGEEAFNHTTDVGWAEEACQVPEVTTAKTVRVTFTEDDDGTDIISSTNAQGKVAIYITYLKY